MVMRAVIAPVVAAVLAFAAGPALAHKPTVRECREAGEFIRNAALSRDAGMPREVFLDRLHGDLMAIRSHPPAMRWFAQDEDDEAFLIQAVERVFDAPKKSTEHESELLESCLVKAGIV
jgi:hypothetical protein